MTLKPRSPVSVAHHSFDYEVRGGANNDRSDKSRRTKIRSSTPLKLAISPLLGLFTIATVLRTPQWTSTFLLQEDPHVYDVLIIGAGWAGIGAGTKLLEHGMNNFVILEAREYAGGRSRTIYPFAKDLAVEVGSAWTYEDTEPHEMMLEHDIKYGEVHYDEPDRLGLFDPQGEITGEARTHLLQLWEDYCEYSEQQAERLEEKHEDRSYQYILDKYLNKKQKKLSTQDVQFLRTMVHAQIEVEFTAPASLVSGIKVGDHANECIFCDADYYVPVQGGGFDKILQPLVKPLMQGEKIQFHSAVTRIDHDQGQVTYTDRKTGRQTIKRAKSILVTVPLGVLKKRKIEFIPPLPQAKLDAIDVVGFGVLNKCILYWDQDQSSWWPEGKEVLEFVNKDNRFTTFFNDKQLGNGGHFVLSAWIGGDQAVAMEGRSDETIVATVLKNLRAMLGDKVPKPTSHVISRWEQDEFAYGSYTYSTVGREGLMESARRELGVRTGTKLFWAGEATHEKWSGTTVGAYRSGLTAAEDILLTLQHRLTPKSSFSGKANRPKTS